MDVLTQAYSHVLPEMFDTVAEVVGQLHNDMFVGNKKAAQDILPQGVQEYLQ